MLAINASYAIIISLKTHLQSSLHTDTGNYHRPPPASRLGTGTDNRTMSELAYCVDFEGTMSALGGDTYMDVVSRLQRMIRGEIRNEE